MTSAVLRAIATRAKLRTPYNDVVTLLVTYVALFGQHPSSGHLESTESDRCWSMRACQPEPGSHENSTGPGIILRVPCRKDAPTTSFVSIEQPLTSRSTLPGCWYASTCVPASVCSLDTTRCPHRIVPPPLAKWAYLTVLYVPRSAATGLPLLIIIVRDGVPLV